MAYYDNGINAINNYANDPMFLAALGAYNPNFMGTQAAQSAQAAQGVTTQQTTTTTSPALPKADYNTEPDSNTGLIVGAGVIAAGAASMIYAAKKGNGKGIIQGFKNIFGKEASKAVTNGVKKAETLGNIRVAMKGKTPVYYIPGKTTTSKNATEIAKLMQDNKELEKLKGFRFRTGETNINSGTYSIKFGKNEYSITFDGEKVKEIKQLTGKGKDKILTKDYIDKDGKFIDTFKDDTMQERAEAFHERLNKILEGDWSVISSKETNLENFVYTTKMGDNVAKIARKQISTHGAPTDNITINELTTLKGFKATDDEVLAYIRTARENGNNVDSLVGKDFLKEHKLPEGYKVHEFITKYGKQDIKVVDGKLDSIYIDGKWYRKGSTKYEAFLERDKHDVEIEKLIAKKLKDNSIPEGATIIPV